MRAHEKMLLNSKLMQAIPFGRHYGKGAGCALGMIEGPDIECSPVLNPFLAEKQYPWLLNNVLPPCSCNVRFDPESQFPTWTGSIAIAHLFNEHVFAGNISVLAGMRFSSWRAFPNAEPWTLERLADYIKSIDPTVDPDEELVCEEVVYDNKEIKA